MSLQTARECISCFVRQAVEAVEMSSVDAQTKERLLRKLLSDISEADWNVMPVVIAQRIQRVIRKETGENDPYRQLKDKTNKVALELLPSLSVAARKQPDLREAIVRLAIAGNLLDAGSKTRLEPENMSAHLNAIWNKKLSGSAAELFNAAENAGSILYLADNAGEIVFDRLLIEALPTKKITVAVRGAPVINDATIDDAKTAGITELVPVVTNGSDAPGTLIEECSEEFKELFNDAELIISKGQGNYETLSGTEKNTFFLLTVKCPLIASLTGAPVGALVVQPNFTV